MGPSAPAAAAWAEAHGRAQAAGLRCGGCGQGDGLPRRSLPSPCTHAPSPGGGGAPSPRTCRQDPTMRSGVIWFQLMPSSWRYVRPVPMRCCISLVYSSLFCSTTSSSPSWPPAPAAAAPPPAAAAAGAPAVAGRLRGAAPVSAPEPRALNVRVNEPDCWQPLRLLLPRAARGAAATQAADERMGGTRDRAATGSLRAPWGKRRLRALGRPLIPAHTGAPMYQLPSPSGIARAGVHVRPRSRTCGGHRPSGRSGTALPLPRST